MKIAIILPNDFSIVTFCGALVEFLQNGDQNKVYAVCGVHGQHGENTSGYYSEIMKSWGVAHLPISYYRFLSVRKDIKYIFSLYRILRNEKFDMVVNIATKANIYGSIIAKIIGTKNIACSVWGLGVNFGDHPGIKEKGVKSLILLLYKIAFRFCNRVWFTNEHDYNWFLSKRIVKPSKSFLTRNYVNTSYYSPVSVPQHKILDLRRELGLNLNDRSVVMVARMSWAKGVKEFVEAAAILRDGYPTVKFILVGPMDDGSPDCVPESYLKENEKYQNFVWTGFRKDVPVFYALADLAVLPSYYREGGFPRGLTEAMAMGKPIITTDSVHCRATVEDGKNGYHVPIKDSKALASAIEKIIVDNDKMEKFGRYSREKALNELDERKIVSEVVRKMMKI